MPAKRLKSPIEPSSHAGYRLAELRKARSITQVQLAAHLGISQGNVSLYELGALRIPTDLLPKMARLLGVTTDELLGLKPTQSPPLMKDRRFLRRLHEIDELPKRDRDALLRIINACLARARAFRTTP